MEEPIGRLVRFGTEYEILDVLDSDTTDCDDDYCYAYLQVTARYKNDDE